MSVQPVAFKQRPVTHTARVRIIGKILIGICIQLMLCAGMAELWLQADYVRLSPIEFLNQKVPSGLAAFTYGCHCCPLQWFLVWSDLHW